MSSTFAWCGDLALDDLVFNASKVAPWLTTDHKVRIVGIDIDATALSRGIENQQDTVWRIGITLADSTPKNMQILENGEIVFKIPETVMMNSYDVISRAKNTINRNAALTHVMEYVNKYGVSPEVVSNSIGALLTDKEHVVCSQTMINYDIPWLTTCNIIPENHNINYIDTGMLIKSGAIPTRIMPGEQAPEFYRRLCDHRLSGFKYSIDGFIRPVLVGSGIIVDHPQDQLEGHASWSSYASASMLQKIREVCWLMKDRLKDITIEQNQEIAI